MVKDLRSFYINGVWTPPAFPWDREVINPATEEIIATISIAGKSDVGRAVAAARRAFPAFAATPLSERKALLRRILECYQARYEEFAQAISSEMGAPITLARDIHALTAVLHLQILLEKLDSFSFENDQDGARIYKDPIGVCAFITPWNFPVHQVMSKVAPALAAGCAMVLKPSEMSPTSTYMLAEVMHEAGVPSGVFNLINGDGPQTGDLLSSHADIDAVSFTGSTRAGIAVAQAAAKNVTRPSLELGGKSANIIVDDVLFEQNIVASTHAMMMNAGQNCMAPSRLLVPQARVEEAASVAASVASAIRLGATDATDTQMGPVVSKRQWENIQRLIAKGVEEGAKLACGGSGLPEGITRLLHTPNYIL